MTFLRALDHVMGLPVLLRPSSCTFAIATTPAEPLGASIARFPSGDNLPSYLQGRLPHCHFRGLLSVHSRYGLRTRRLTHVILYTEGFSRFVASTTAPIATGWSDSLPGGIRTHWKCAPFHGAQSDMGTTDDTLKALNRLEKTIQEQREQLLQAHGVLTCLYETLLHADGEQAVSYAQAACVAASLINKSASPSDRVEEPRVLFVT